MKLKIIDQLKQLQKKLDSKAFSEDIARYAMSLVYKRTKDGYGVDRDDIENPKRVKLAALSPAYKKQRKKKKLGPYGKPNFSNLTLTGQMLEAMVYDVKRGGFIIKIDNTSRYDSSDSNFDISEYVRDPKHGDKRPFLALTTDEQIKVKAYITKQKRKLIRELLK